MLFFAPFSLVKEIERGGSVFPSCSHRLDDASCKGAANPMCSTELWQHCIVDHLLPAASCPRPICVEANNYRSRSVTSINRDVLLLYSMKGAAVSWDVGDHSPSSPRTKPCKIMDQWSSRTGSITWSCMHLVRDTRVIIVTVLYIL